MKRANNFSVRPSPTTTSDCYVTCWTRVPLSRTELITTARDSDEDDFDFEDEGIWDTDTGKLEGNYN